MSDLTPPTGPDAPQPARPPYGQYPQPVREGKSVSFYLAIFLALLLFVSGGLNLVLLFVSAVGSATSGFTTLADEDDAMYDVVAVAGDMSAQQRILRLPVEGAISEAGAPLIGASGGTVSYVRRSLKFAARDDSIGGVLLEINSPGGGVTDSDEIWRAIGDFKDETEKPVVALFGDIAASGGYYIAAACDRIYARHTTITGSIGVIMSSYNFAELAERHGVSEISIVSKRTPFKNMLSSWKPVDDSERAIVESIVDEMYDRFVDVVSKGRPNLTPEEVERIANGQIYSAKQAKANGLIDDILTPAEAYDALEEMMEVDSARVVERRRRPTLSEVLFGVRGRTTSLDAVVAQLATSVSGPRFLYFWPGGR